MPGPCGSHKKHQVLPGNTFCERCGKRVYKRRDKDLQTIYKAYVKQLHSHFYIAGYCIDCGLERENHRRPWTMFLKRYGTGHYGIPICATRWNQPS